MIAILRISGPELDVDQCLKWIPADRLEASWRRGDQRLGRGAAPSAGINVLLADSEKTAEGVESARAALLGFASEVKALVDAGCSATVDFGIEVSESLPASIRVPPEFLGLLFSSGIRLEVSAYPCAEDDE